MAKRKATRIRDYESLVPSFTKVTFDKLEGQDFKSLSYAEKMKLVDTTVLKRTVVRNDDGGVFFGIYSVLVKRCGRNIFHKSVQDCVIYIKPSGGRICCLSTDSLREFLHIYGIRWADDIAKDASLLHLFCKVPLIRSILTGTIHSEETFWRFVARNCHKINDVPWRVFRSYYTKGLSCVNSLPHLADIRDFTENTANSMRRILSCFDKKDGEEELQFIDDAVKDAVKIGERINLGKWSLARLKEHHKEQVRELMKQSLPDNATEPLYQVPAFVNADGIRLLSSVSDVFEEGSMMSHCLYTNYMNDISKGRELAFHFDSGEQECTFAVVRETLFNRDSCRQEETGRCALQQVYQSHNRGVSESVRERVLQFIEDNTAGLLSLMQERAKAYKDLALATEGLPAFYRGEDLPF